MHKQDGGVEGHALIFPMRTPKMQLADRNKTKQNKTKQNKTKHRKEYAITH